MRFACHGGCPKDRFIRTPDGEPGLNYLCAGYKAFFGHIDRPMRMMADLLRRDLPPSEIMRCYAAEDAKLQGRVARAGRNDPCPVRQRQEVQAVPRFGDCLKGLSLIPDCVLLAFPLY